MATEKRIYAGVRLLDAPFHLDRTYTYYIPPEMEQETLVGCFVSVPFGGGNRKVPAIITEVSDTFDGDYEVKPVDIVSSSEPVLDSELMELCRFLVSHTLCTFGEAARAVVPSQAMSKLADYYSITEKARKKDYSKLNEKAILILNYIGLSDSVSLTKLKSQFGSDVGEAISTLLKLKLIERDVKVKEASSGKFITYVSLDNYASDETAKLRSPLQKDIVELLKKTGRISTDEMFVRLGKNVSPQISSLVKKGIVKAEKIECFRNPYITECVPKTDTSTLSAEQLEAYNKAVELYEKDGPSALLLHGVTGSGKTRVIKAMIDRVVADGKGVIVLVPEISLTPQTVSFFCGCYGERVSVIHSALSQGERYDAWRRIRDGKSDIVIGTRSAIFAPLKNLGMIVIDEEQEHTYKSDTDPKYYAHDVASFRCGKNGAFLLLSSATPSLTSYYKAVTGKYSLQKMISRYGDAKLPEVIIEDMRERVKEGSTANVGKSLAQKLNETKQNGKKAIVFLNRRGYSSSVICNMCGDAIKCPRCSVSLTYHTRAPLGNADTPEEYQQMRASRGSLTCHYCGYTTKIPSKCPTCASLHFRFIGCGTQQAEEEIQKAVEGVRVLRMDYDTTKAKDSHRKILQKFRNGEADVLLGTQMVTKGHDFPDVNLVGVMNADSSLYLDDYRAAEKTFSMLTQVIGRAGRADANGVAVIQTFNPESETIKLSAAQDYEKFYENEIKLRKALVFPPFCDIITVTLSSQDEALLSASAVKLNEFLKKIMEEKYNDVMLTAYGPFEAPVYKVQNTCRLRMVFKCRITKRVRELVADILFEFGKHNSKNLIISADFNPSNL